MKSIHIVLIGNNEGNILLTKETPYQGKIRNSASIVRDGWGAMLISEKKGKHFECPDSIHQDIILPKSNGSEFYLKSNHPPNSTNFCHYANHFFFKKRSF